MTKDTFEDALIELNYLGIDNVLAVRGDDLRKDLSLDNQKSKNNLQMFKILQTCIILMGRLLGICSVSPCYDSYN